MNRQMVIGENGNMLARDIMSTDIVTVGPGHSILHAAQIMLGNKVSGVPVIGDTGKLIGLLTEGDLIRRTELGGGALRGSSATETGNGDRAADYIRSRSWRVSDVMSRDVISVPAECSLACIAELMERHHCKRVPVVRDSTMIGIVSRADLLRAIVSVPPEHTIWGDNALRIATMARLATDAGLEEFELRVMIEDGHVTLGGTVETVFQRDAARVAAESVSGCKSVTNDITLSGAESRNGN